MSKLTKEEKIDWLKHWKEECSGGPSGKSYCPKCTFKPSCDLAYQQIREMIQSHPNSRQNVAQGQGKVTEEFVEKWIEKLTETYPSSSTDTWYFRKQLVKMFKEADVHVL